MLRAPLWALLGLLLVADGLPACGSSCDKENEAAREVDSGLSNGNEYETGAWNENYLDFPAGRRLKLLHHLNATPNEIKSYLAFVQHPLAEGKNGNTAESAGNQVIIEAVNDQYIQVHNDTCEHFYLRIVATVFATGATGGTGGTAGTSAAAGAAGTSGEGGI